jgi:hypothetical protein
MSGFDFGPNGCMLYQDISETSFVVNYAALHACKVHVKRTKVTKYEMSNSEYTYY